MKKNKSASVPLMEAVDNALAQAMQQTGEATLTPRKRDAQEYAMLVGQFNGLKEARRIMEETHKAWMKGDLDDE